MTPFLIAANWKMYKSPQEVEAFFSELKSQKMELKNKTLLFFAPAIDLVAVSNCCVESAWGWGAQNTHFEDEGAFTGETSPAVVSSLGATHGLVGHSERRSLFHEDCALLAKKMTALFRNEIIPVFCLGETLEQRKAGETLAILRSQLSDALVETPKDAIFHLAYEPVWAIGTGEVATVDQVAEAHHCIRQYLDANYTRSSEISILYGGSVKPNNAEELSKVDNVGGFLIGSAALKVESLVQIVEASQS